jgi:penicillin amidase
MRRIVRIISAAVAISILLLAVGGVLIVRRSFPKYGGTIELPGLGGKVEVLWDEMGVPHIYASSTEDLFMAQGYVHAQDRFWQMDFWRHIGAGRLAEMFGESQVETDAFLRTLGWEHVAESELATADAETLAIMQAYSRGVNAYLEAHRGAALSLEYAILRLLNPAYSPDPWTPVNSLTWAKVMAWDLGGNMSEEVQRAVLLPIIGEERLADLFPPYPQDHPVIVPSTDAGQASTEILRSSQAAIPPSALRTLAARAQALDDLIGTHAPGIGSNNWVISGSRTTTGLPLLANDMHLGIQMPSIWYEISLHCQPVGPECPFQVSGFSFAGVPAVIVGHNDHIAWGVTNVNPDVQDLYLERTNPEDPDQYLVNGQWMDMAVREEILRVAGGEPVTISVRSTRHGPVISDVDDDIGALADVAGEESQPLAVSLRWTALEPARIFRAVLALNRATNWEQFRAALSNWDVPSQNFVYADTAGNIGYQTPGRIPIRAHGDGTAPVPGWTDEYEWSGYVPFEELPSSYNPSQGFIVTANNAVTGPGYPYFLTAVWDYGYRAQRIQDLIEGAGTLSAADLQNIHADNYNAMGPVLIPLLQSLDLTPEKSGGSKSSEDLKAYVSLLSTWDFQDDMNSGPSALFNAVWRHVILRTFADDLPAGWLPGGSRAFGVMTRLVEAPNSPWWDDRTTPAPEDRDAILRLGLEDAVSELKGILGKTPSDWSWGQLHTATFRNASLGESGIAPIEALFNRGPFPVGGGSSIVNATGWDVEQGYEVQSLPSERMIIDLADFDNSLWIHPTGQSGHAFHRHYIDMADMWRLVQYRPMCWSRQAIASDASDVLQLGPSGESR